MNLGSLLATVLTGTQWGHLWLWRLATLMALAVVLRHRSGILLRENGRETLAGQAHWVLLALAPGLGSGVLLTLSLGSHGAATANIREAAIGADYLHLLAAAGWMGGLFHLTSDVPHILRTLGRGERGAFLAILVSRFSLVAILCVGTLITTGLYSAWAQVAVLPALRTPYGLTLLTKLALLIPLLLLGALNLLWVRPRLAHEDRAGRWLCRFVAGEAVLSTLVLGAVGCLTSLEPAGQAAARQGLLSDPGITFSDLAEGTHIRLTLVPGRVGLNRLRISLTDHWGVPIAQASEVSLRLHHLEADLGETTLSARALGDGTYALEQVLLSIAGPWQAQLLVRRADAFDARSTFQVTVMPGRSDLMPAITPTRHTGMLLWGGLLVLLGGLCLVMGIPLRGWRTPVGALVIGCGLLCTLAGLLVVHQQMAQSGALTAPAMLESFRETPRRQRTTHHGAGQGERRDT